MFIEFNTTLRDDLQDAIRKVRRLKGMFTDNTVLFVRDNVSFEVKKSYSEKDIYNKFNECKENERAKTLGRAEEDI